MTSYAEFIASKRMGRNLSGFKMPKSVNKGLFDYQLSVLDFSIEAGRSACFLDTGLGKTFIQLEWARMVSEHANAPVLILAPLAVAAQTAREGKKFGIDVTVCKSQADVKKGVNVANYERLHLFDTTLFAGVVLDESSILKSFMGKTKQALVSGFEGTPYKLACTATPAPNDYMELGNHCEFLNVMPSPEMLSRWFINDTMNFGTYRLKKHAVAPFWDWVASWARCISMPSDLGFSDEGFVLPMLSIVQELVDASLHENTGDALFRQVELNATSLHKEKRLTAPARADRAAELALTDEPVIIWCDSNYEADAIKARIKDAVEVRGSDSLEKKEDLLMAFSDGKERCLITKPSIAGYGLNWQHCNKVVFAGFSYSYESFYQAVRRCWRFGQKRPVSAHVCMAETELPIWTTVMDKADDHSQMKHEMKGAMARNAAKSSQVRETYIADHTGGLPKWLSA